MTPPTALLWRAEPFESERLLIRSPRAGDGPRVHAGVVASLAALRAFPASLPWALAEPSVETSEAFCCGAQQAWGLGTAYPMLLLRRHDGTHVGNSGVHAVDWNVPKCEIGYWIRSDQTGHGYATEAVRAISEWAFEHLAMRRIEARPDAENHASCRVLERAGYALEGTMRHERATVDGRMRDTRLYACVR